MDISAKALRRIRELKTNQGLSSQTGIRLGLNEAAVSLKWEESGPRSRDLIIKKEGIRIFIDAGSYYHLADYELDLEGPGGAGRFVFRHKRISDGGHQGDK